MIQDITKSPQSSKYKSLSQEWNNLIKQFKTQSKPRVDLPPIIFQRKSPLENYKNAIKLHQSLSRKKTITRKILDLSKKRKISTININENIKHHKRFNSSDNAYTLTEQEKQLLNSTKHLRKSTHLNYQTQKQHTQLNNETHRQKMNTNEIIKQIKAYHQQHVARQKQRENIKQIQRLNNNNNNINNRATSTYNNRKQSKSSFVNANIQQNQYHNHYNSSINNIKSGYSSTIQQLINNNTNTSNKNINQYPHSRTFQPYQQNKQINNHNNNNSNDEDHQTEIKNRTLSFQLSKDYKSLRFRYEKQQQASQRGDQSIAKMLIKNRRQKVQHIFSIFSPSKMHKTNQNNNHNSYNLTESQRVLKLYPQSDCQQKQRHSHVQITQQSNKSVIMSPLNSNNNSPSSKTSIFSPIKRKRQRNYLKKYTPTNNLQLKLKLNINTMDKDYEPWNDVVNENMVSQQCDVQFGIENYYHQGEGSSQFIQTGDAGDKLKSKTVVIM